MHYVAGGFYNHKKLVEYFFVYVEGILPWLIFLLQLMCKVPKKLVQCAFSPSQTKSESLKLSPIFTSVPSNYTTYSP
jgi:hypothetical protein